MRELERLTIPAMKRRILATFLWFYAWWYAGAIVADVFLVSPMLGPIIGAAAAALFVGDPRRIIWSDPGSATGARDGAPDGELGCTTSRNEEEARSLSGAGPLDSWRVGRWPIGQPISGEPASG